MKHYKFLFLISLFLSGSLYSADNSQKIFDVAKMGAIPNTVATNTAAINAAIAKCSESGGGTVVISGGEYIVGTIILKDNVTLNIPEGSALRGSKNLKDYIFPRKGENEKIPSTRWLRALIYGVGVKNVRITGGGVIDGCHLEDYAGEEKMRGPHGIFIGDAENVSVDNLQICRAGNYAVMMQEVRDVKCTNLKIDEGWDGVHVRGCENLVIKDCEFHTGDDCIAGGRWKNAKISSCLINSACNGFRLIGPAENLLMENCKFFGDGKYTHRSSYNRKRRDMLSAMILQPGAWSKSPGPLKNVMIKNIEADNMRNLISLYPNEENEIDGVYFENVKGVNIGVQAIQIENWQPSSTMKNIFLKNFDVQYKGNPPESITPNIPLTPRGLDARALPVWGFFAKNIDGLTLENISLRLSGKDPRKAAYIEDVSNVKVSGLSINGKSCGTDDMRSK